MRIVAPRTILTLARRGILTSASPTRLVHALAVYRRWGPTLAGGYVIGSILYPDRSAVIDDRGTVTYVEMNNRAARLAEGLRSLGVDAEDRVAVLCRNHRQLVETLVACSRIGANAVLLHTGLPASQTIQLVRDLHVTLIVADTEFSELLDHLPVTIPRVTAWADTPADEHPNIDTLIAECQPIAETSATPTQDELIVLTSGTTGVPKGAMLTSLPNLASVTAVLSRLPLHTNSRTLLSPPLFHAWGIAALRLSVALGSTTVLQRRFSAPTTLRVLAQNECAAWFTVPIMMRHILDLPPDVPADLTHLRIVACSGSALLPTLAAEFQQRYGPILYSSYGSTEAWTMTIATPADLHVASPTAGRPLPGVHLTIRDPHGKRLRAGSIGDIAVTSDMRFQGYTDGTAASVTGGLLYTGDNGYLDTRGRLFITGRSDDMIVSGGENIHLAEIEALLNRLPRIREATVIGTPDDYYGQRLIAYIVTKPGEALTESDVQRHLLADLPRHAVPRDVVFLHALPRNLAGKIDRHALPRPTTPRRQLP